MDSGICDSGSEVSTISHPKFAEDSTASTEAHMNGVIIDEALPSELSPRRQRMRRAVSPTFSTSILETFAEPLSPSSTSQNNSSDITFEPSIDMMVHDFDDEQTLEEEEEKAKAEESEDPQDEIATLKAESEMPIEELLAKYRALPIDRSPKNSKSPILDNYKLVNQKNDCSEIPCSANEVEEQISQITTTTNDNINISEKNKVEEAKGRINGDDFVQPLDKLPCHSHLLELYPEENFASVIGSKSSKDFPLEIDYYEDDDNELDYEDNSSDYVRKTIMVGTAYQAVIPDGLSQYGDVLPYENEDKLIWEPSQVSENEVEKYLVTARDIKPPFDNESLGILVSDDVAIKDNNVSSKDLNVDIIDTSMSISDLANEVNPTTTVDHGGIVKDNEQALHLLVQCGYDFKEALRRKRLNAVPLTGSFWSEDECHKFEEGIHKFGKDFLKIRQNQVRTRTMRELVQFYYLWKKSDRRDHDFANSDTVDHMDIYLNEGGDYTPNTVSITDINGTSVAITPSLSARKNSNGNLQKNFSIMTGRNGGPGTINLQTKSIPKANSGRRRSLHLGSEC